MIRTYGPVSILPFLSKVYERVMHEQTSNYFEHFLNKILCRFRKAHSTEHALFKLFSTSWKFLLNIGGFLGSILMDLSKAQDYLKDDLLLPKLQAYGFSKESIKLYESHSNN